MARLCKLSEEMVVEILSRLPPKSLMRFKCVRRSWCDLIQNPNFVEKHLSNPKHNKLASSTSIIVKLTVPKGTNIKDKEENFIRNKINLTPDMMDVFSLLNLFDDVINDGDVHHAVTVDVDNFWLRKLPFNVKMLGHCDGIICLQYPNDIIVLCNPAIKEFKLLPESCLLHPPWPRRHLGIDKGEEIITYSNATGFGYDSKTKQYKVVRIVNFLPRPSSEEEVCTPRRKAAVYTLGTNSWRVIECDIKVNAF
nr:F-box/kelch-repeat protein At3g06240-like [Malus domestica]